MDITLKSGKKIPSGLVMFPSGHALNTTADLKTILAYKNRMLGDIVFSSRSEVDAFVNRLMNMKSLSAGEVQSIYEFDWATMKVHDCIDG